MLQNRQFANQKLLILIIIVLKFQIEDEQLKFYRLFQQDLQLCTACFQDQSKNCKEFLTKLTPNDELELRYIFGIFMPIARRQMGSLKIKNTNIQLIGKYLAKDKHQLSEIKTQELNSELLASIFHKESRLDGVQFCSKKSLPRFMQLFRFQHNDLTIWFYLLLNVQSLLMPFLSARNFSVPQHYATCGFSLFQQYAGEPLNSFYGIKDFRLKLRIAKLLLEAVLQLTQGFEGFRIYVTDLNADNIVYSVAEDRLSFVDLDTVLIGDSHEISQQQSAPHKHEYIECMDCFAYSPQDICQRSSSDINIFAACQLLREDLKKDARRGFLQPIPKKYSHLIGLLNECVDCFGSKCVNRFAAAHNLIEAIERIISS